ncbi:hemagglutinin/amebocyte aggregation factor-like [Pecten maximus]|uniref:hemagglutinin/amebocyte aggregation factor-like n=1 Tax=Pecten maximus TaxID=6579 RepID=UPI001458B5DC|nr:hemagglutinin/amebocyte aggregation factor-like [Pecten maximus]
MRIDCGQAQHLERISSTYSTTHRDRKWSFACRPTPASIKRRLSCAWSSYINYYDDTFEKACSGHGFLNGLYSIYNEHFVDRRWRVRCCYPVRHDACNCYYTGYVNWYQETLNYAVPSNRFVAGIRSLYSAHYRDRTFSFRICEVA